MGTTLPAPPAPPPAPKSTPLDPAEIYYNLKWRVPPLVVTTQEQKDQLDPTEWTLDPSNPSVPQKTGAGKTGKKDQWPKLYANVNLAPKIVATADDAAALGEEWREFTIPDDLAKAAYATNQAKAQADAAKAQAQQQQSQAASPYGQGLYGQALQQGQYPGQYQYPYPTQY